MLWRERLGGLRARVGEEEGTGEMGVMKRRAERVEGGRAAQEKVTNQLPPALESRSDNAPEYPRSLRSSASPIDANESVLTLLLAPYDPSSVLGTLCIKLGRNEYAPSEPREFLLVLNSSPSSRTPPPAEDPLLGPK